MKQVNPLLVCGFIVVFRWVHAANQPRLKVDGIKSRQAVLWVMTSDSAQWAAYIIKLTNQQTRKSREFRRAAQPGNVTIIHLLHLGPNTSFGVRVMPVESKKIPEKWTAEIKFKTLGTRPTIHGLVSRLNARAGRRVNINCNATGHPLPTVTWYKKSDMGDMEIAKGRLLTLNNVTLDTEGLYKCVATNGNKPDAEQSVVVQAIEPPFINVKPEDQEIKLGDSINLTCSAKGRPVPLIKWYRDGEFYQTGNSLRIERSSARHEGTYRCEASNGILNFTDVATAHVSIIYEPQNMTISATVVKADTISCKLGQTVTLKCHGTSRHVVTYKWVKDDKVIAEQREMEIKVIKQSDFGAYKCQASNKAGSSTTVIRIVPLHDRERETDDSVISIPSRHFWITAGCLGVLLVGLLFLICILNQRKKSPIYETPRDIDSPTQDPRGQRVTLRSTNTRHTNPHPFPLSNQDMSPSNNTPGPISRGIYASLLPLRDYMNRDRRDDATVPPDYVNMLPGSQPSPAACAPDYEEPRRFFSFGRRKGPRYPR